MKFAKTQLQSTSENQRKCLIFRKSALWTIVIVKVYKLNTLGQLGNRSEFSSRAILGREGLQHPSAQRVNPIRDVNVFLGNRIFEMFLFQGFQPLIHSYLEIFSPRLGTNFQKLFSVFSSVRETLPVPGGKGMGFVFLTAPFVAGFLDESVFFISRLHTIRQIQQESHPPLTQI